MVALDARANDGNRAGVLAGIDHASRTHGYGRFGEADEVKQQPVDARWISIALASLTSTDETAVVAAIDVLLDAPPQAAWKPALEKAQKHLDKKAESSAIEVLLESIAALSPTPATLEARPAAGPLSPLKRAKAPAPPRPRLVPASKLSAKIDTMLAAAGLTARRSVLVQPAFHVLTKRVADDALPLGATRIGGLPDLPVGTPSWRCTGERLRSTSGEPLKRLERVLTCARLWIAASGAEPTISSFVAAG